MKVIDLLNKMANCEDLPYKIKVDNMIFILENGFYFKEDSECYEFTSGRMITGLVGLNDHVEIIDDNKIHKLVLSTELEHLFEYDENKRFEYYNENFKNMINKINEIIEYLQEIN